MKNKLNLLVVFALCSLLPALCSFADITPELRWYVDVERPAKYDLSLRRGETVNLEPTFRNYGTAIDLTAAHLVVLRYAPANATNWYYVTTGTVHSATGGTVQVTWSSACEATNNTYSYEIAVQSTTAMLMRNWGTITLTASVAADGSTSAAPTAVTSIDWATVDHSNIGAAPFLSDFDTADLSAFDATLTNGTADLDVDTLIVRRVLTASAAGLTNFPTTLVTNVVNGGTSGTTGAVSRTDGTVTLTFPLGGGGSGGSTNLDGLSDVTVTTPTQGQTLTYDEILGGWTNGAASGEGLGTNRLTWVVGGVTIGYVDTNGITMLQGSLTLYEEDLHCNVLAYDGARTAPSVAFYAQPKMGWYRKSYEGDYAWAFAHNSNDVLFAHQNGLTMSGTNGISSYYFQPVGAYRVAGTNGITTNLSVITSVLTNESGVVTGLVSQTLNIRKGIILP